MKHSAPSFFSAVLAIAATALLIGVPTACNAQKPSAAAQQKIASLRELRDSGVISQDEYNERVAALTNGGGNGGGAAAGAAAQAGSGAAIAAAGGPHRTVQIPDFAMGMTAATATIPANWGFSGVAIHMDNCVVTGHNIVLRMESRDGLSGVEVLPSLRAQWIGDPRSMQQYQAQGCIVARTTNPAEFIEQVMLPKMRPGAKVLGVDSDPQLEQDVAQAKRQMSQMRQTPGMTMSIQEARVKIAYTRNGQPEEEYIGLMYTCMDQHQDYPGMAPMHSLDCTSDDVGLMHAPAGQLEALYQRKGELLKIQTNQAWIQRVQNMRAEETKQIAVEGQRKIQESVAKSNADVKQIHDTGAKSMQNAKNVQDSIDRSSGATAAAMGDYNNFTNSETGKTYQVSNQYDHTYQDSQGTIVQTNSAYSPGPSSWWTELKPQY